MRLSVHQVFYILSIISSGYVLAQGTLTSSTFSIVRPSGVPSAGSTLGPGPISISGRSTVSSASVSIETSSTSPPPSSGSSTITVTSSTSNSSSSSPTSTVTSTAPTTSTSSAAFSDKLTIENGPMALIMLPFILFFGVL